MSERCERTSERTSEWPSTYFSTLVCSRPQRVIAVVAVMITNVGSRRCVEGHNGVVKHLFVPIGSVKLIEMDKRQRVLK